MATFRNAVQKAYDSVGDPEKDGVNQVKDTFFNKSIVNHNLPSVLMLNIFSV